MPGVVEAIAATVTAYAAEESARTGRRCLLKRADVPLTILRDLAEGRTRTRAARLAGVSEAVLRRWLIPGMRPVRACAALQGAMTALLSGQPLVDPRPTPMIAATSAAVMPEAMVVPREASPAVPVPAPSPQVIIRWHQLRERASNRRLTDPVEAEFWLQEVARGLKQFGLASVPPLPERWLQPGLDYVAVQNHYIAWCHATGRLGPTDRDVELYAMRWYRAHVVLPEQVG